MQQIRNTTKKDPYFRQDEICNIPFSIYITRIPTDIDMPSLAQYLTQFGEFDSCYISRRKNGKSVGYGYVLAGNKKTFDNIIGAKHFLQGRQMMAMPF
jgi:RNA recognition motif-containing protein